MTHPAASATLQPASTEILARHLTAAKEKSGKGDHCGAANAYRVIFELTKTPVRGMALAREQRDCGNWIEAVATADEVLTMRVPGRQNEPAPVVAAYHEAEQLSVELKPRIPSIDVKVVGPSDRTTVSVTVDGIAPPPATIGTPILVNPGRRSIAVRASGYWDEQRHVTVRESERTLITLNLVSSYERSVLIASSLILAGVGATVGGVTYVLAGKKERNAEGDGGCNNNVCLPAAKQELDSADRFRRVATWSFVASAACATAAAATVLLWRRPNALDAEPHASVSLRVAGDGQLSILGEF